MPHFVLHLHRSYTALSMCQSFTITTTKKKNSVFQQFLVLDHFIMANEVFEVFWKTHKLALVT